ncbi:HIT family protein [Pseudonocardia oroxyli]|uniref:Diadenosine tetraphosphate (Ap4A) hydrolase n=1 Tax=Pseudonocardia oroxyli TaxID=366584 RepID=A0A1G7JMN3_PSEOR|nr:HIT family protein [Pseudonocardia oroxyli]SDF26197.1 Diadenosine tetraphosphate (Ap4A) hydrolase [Pseudonocardia oroxyli]
MSDGRLAALRRGEKPQNLVGETASGYAVFGDHQKLPGYCLLIHRGEADHLTDLEPPERTAFLEDLALLGQAVDTALRGDPAFRRLNYEILGNSWPHLHAHVHPRYSWEPDEYRSRPVWRYPDLDAEEHRADAAHAELRDRIALELRALVIGGA